MSFKINVRAKKALSDEVLDIIQKILEASCNGEVCLRKATIYEEVQKHIELDMELYRFEQALTEAIKLGRLPGFETRPGRAGGICRLGAFDARDKAKQSKRPKPTEDSCYLCIGNCSYKVPLSEQAAEKLITEVFDGQLGSPVLDPPDDQPTLYRSVPVVWINHKSFRVPHLTMVSRVIHNYLNYIGSNLIEG